MADSDSLGKVFILFSSAAGVGRTTVGLNLAQAIRTQGFRTIIVDFDLQFGDVCNYLKIDPQTSCYQYQQAFAGAENVAVESYIIKGNNIPDIMAAPANISDAWAFRPSTAERLVKYLKQRYDYIFIDTCSGFSNVILPILKSADEICFICVIDFIATIKNIKSAYTTLLNLGIQDEKIKFILNRNQAKTDIGQNDVETMIGHTFFQRLPNDFAITTEAINKGLPVIVAYPESELATQLGQLSVKFTGVKFAEPKKEEKHPVKKRFSFFG